MKKTLELDVKVPPKEKFVKLRSVLSAWLLNDLLLVRLIEGFWKKTNNTCLLRSLPNMYNLVVKLQPSHCSESHPKAV